MDWAEELKMSIKKVKTTAKKGRRSKSRDILKEKTTKNSSTTSSSINSPSGHKTKEISIDITLDLQQSSDSAGVTTAAAASHKPATILDSDAKRPPVRRISGGWADSGVNVLKSSRSKRISYDDDRFQQAAINSAASSPPEDDIPVIPDLDDIKDETRSSELESPTLPLKPKTPKDYNSDLLSQNAFKALGNVNLTVLTRCLYPPEYLDEADEIWDWDKVFTDVVAEINADKSRSTQKIKIGPDEVPPAMNA